MMVAKGTPLEDLKKHLALVQASGSPLSLGRPAVDALLGGGLPICGIVEVSCEWS
jgi:hypothetical protein